MVHSFRFLNKPYTIARLGEILDLIWCKLKKASACVCVKALDGDWSDVLPVKGKATSLLELTFLATENGVLDGYIAAQTVEVAVQDTGAALVESLYMRHDGNALSNTTFLDGVTDVPLQLHKDADAAGSFVARAASAPGGGRGIQFKLTNVDGVATGAGHTLKVCVKSCAILTASEYVSVGS
jgi:hypothetical protein